MRRSEVVYDRLATIPANRRTGLPTLVCGADLSECQVRCWESALYGSPVEPKHKGQHHISRLARPPAPDLPPNRAFPAALGDAFSAETGPLHRPLQQTFTWRFAKSDEHWYRERSQMRFVVQELGRPLTQFENTKLP